MTLVAIALIATIGALAFGLAARQSLLSASVGTDHSIHAFLIRAINANRRRLFVRIPRILNEAYCAALPLYLHLCFAQLRPGAMFWAERLLNPIVNTLHVLLFAGLASLVGGQGWTFVVLATGLFALTPQFYHALSARNFGLSARGIGLFLLSMFMLAAYWAGSDPGAVHRWIPLIVAGCLIWAFSTFGAQTLVIVTVLMALVTGRFVPLGGATLGLLLFIALHPRYSTGYLRHTLRFIRAYASELAPIYILNRRHSIWRDLVWDIWSMIRRSPRAGIRYAYENSVVVVFVLAPLLVVAVTARIAGWLPEDDFTLFSADVASCGAAAALLTSFRKTRFLGEPERYVEAIMPWATIAGAGVLFASLGWAALLGLAAGFLLMDLAQIRASKMLVRYLARKPLDLSAAEGAIRDAQPHSVRLCSNNEQLTKLLMANDWDFAYCIAVGQDYCGMRITDAFSRFPYLRREAIERIIQSCRINICVLDRSQYETIFDTRPAGLRAARVIHETEGVRVLAFDWEAPATAESTTRACA